MLLLLWLLEYINKTVSSRISKNTFNLLKSPFSWPVLLLTVRGNTIQNFMFKFQIHDNIIRLVNFLITANISSKESNPFRSMVDAILG